ncbi:16S rRNA (uracil(1498)-N(3))-methyltransferase [Clostridium oryzae]|uniref:Ribosomal RNA small subunit methyltransferase E n=1 Tax=Clostridium oryzae TaxID=1450648 RepID=A0A1V4IVM7_9CLOT|nr:16S rRNA (uracil(1498)-N(3))-methyltransferase [Clostridium oryzae]OPJ63845.1 ribosomal RNA small subunit methyltransferase E [Clostridium oryzae]
MHKFFVKPENISGNTAVIDGDDVKHIYKVLRLEKDDEIIINNLADEEFLGAIEEVNKMQVTVKIIKKLDISNESNINITLFQGLPKSTKMDFIVQKSTEIGVKKITPILTERVVNKVEIKEFKKVDRWRRIALEACKQSKRTTIPEIDEPMEFETLLNVLKGFDLIVVPYENAEGFGIKKMCSAAERDNILNVAVIIGPEGGFEQSEIDKLTQLGAYIVTLGPRILRTETAGIITSAILQYELGDMGGII